MNKFFPSEMKQDSFDLHGGVHPTIYDPFLSALLPDLKNKVILDLGCGKGVIGYLIRSQRNLTGSTMIGIDAGKEYLLFTQKHKIYDQTIQSDLKNKLPFKNKSVDFIICSEVIEHLNKQSGEKLLTEIERISKPGTRVVITTPNVWLQMPFKNSLDKHFSLWSVSDFRKKGYTVRGIGIKLPFNKSSWYTNFIFSLYYFMTPFSYIFPKISGLLIAYKDIPQI